MGANTKFALPFIVLNFVESLEMKAIPSLPDQFMDDNFLAKCKLFRSKISI
jgi:hypothetical protein